MKNEQFTRQPFMDRKCSLGDRVKTTLQSMGFEDSLVVADYILKCVDFRTQYRFVEITNEAYLKEICLSGYKHVITEDSDIITRYQVFKILGDVVEGYKQGGKVVPCVVNDDQCIFILRKEYTGVRDMKPVIKDIRFLVFYKKVG